MKTKSITLFSILTLFCLSQISFACSGCGCTPPSRSAVVNGKKGASASCTKDKAACKKSEAKPCKESCTKACCKKADTKACKEGCTKACCKKVEAKGCKKCSEGAKTSVAKPAEAIWHTDFEKVKKAAKAEGKPILMNFSGSDWCYWCIKLEKEVFGEKAFKTYAAENLVLMLVDTPNKSKLPEEVKKQNEKLKSEYAIRGFPTVILLDSSGKKVAQTGYKDGGAEKYVEHIKSLLK